MNPEVRLSSPPGKPKDSSSVDDQSVGTPVGPETGGEKDGPEEEEEEDFDDLTQNEENEMSSASEDCLSQNSRFPTVFENSCSSSTLPVKPALRMNQYQQCRPAV
ncbi:GON-4-like protein [Nomascus leucogenys]|uniref:GON-4-like protein n=1 Tax=Nomascus leucogenys TaxID=61853 RepID=UPI00122DAA17|nr:GON-4-like protein [Nomascus leucogenys]